MKPHHHAAALALVVWYLLTPWRPIPLYPPDTIIINQGPPFTGWRKVAAFPTQQECEAHQDLTTLSVAADDPRFCSHGDLGCVLRLSERHHP